MAGWVGPRAGLDGITELFTWKYDLNYKIKFYNT
jgi:hypothetical protein